MCTPTVVAHRDIIDPVITGLLPRPLRALRRPLTRHAADKARRDRLRQAIPLATPPAHKTRRRPSALSKASVPYGVSTCALMPPHLRGIHIYQDRHRPPAVLGPQIGASAAPRPLPPGVVWACADCHTWEAALRRAPGDAPARPPTQGAGRGTPVGCGRCKLRTGVVRAIAPSLHCRCVAIPRGARASSQVTAIRPRRTNQVRMCRGVWSTCVDSNASGLSWPCGSRPTPQRLRTGGPPDFYHIQVSV
jgi:hypothetical protein